MPKPKIDAEFLPTRSQRSRRRLHRSHHAGPNMYQLTILMDALAASKPEDIVTLQRVARALADDPIIWDLVKKIQEHEKNRMADIEKLKAHFAKMEKGMVR